MTMSTATSTSPIGKVDRELAALRTQNFNDPFLTGPLQSDEQLIPTNSAGLEAEYFSTSPTHDSDTFRSHHPSDRNLSSNPSHKNSPTSYLDCLSSADQTETGQSDLTSFTSPDFDPHFFTDADRPLNTDLGETDHFFSVNPQDIGRPSPQDTNAMLQKHAEFSGGRGIGASQLLSPIHTNTPSPTINPQAVQAGTSSLEQDTTTASPLSIMSGRQSRSGMPAHRLPELTTTSIHNTSLTVNGDPNRDHPTSPIVKVSSFSRGDSPSREETFDQDPRKRGRVALSTGHLSPARDHSPSYFDCDQREIISGHRRTISVPPPTSRNDDGSWHNPLTGQGGLDPASRHDIYVPSIKDMIAEREREEKNADVAQWICLSEAGSDIEDNELSGFRSRRRKLSLRSRRRAKSTGDPFLGTHKGPSFQSGQKRFDDSAIPGPGVLIDEESGREDDDDDYYSDSSPPASINIDTRSDADEGYFPPGDGTESQEPEPLPRQFIRSRPWQDPVTNSSYGGMKQQPVSSNAAIKRFLDRSDNIDTSSRSATWGTRGLTESDVDSIIGPHGRFSSIRISGSKKKGEPARRSSILKQAKGLLPKRSNSSAKRKHMDRQNTTELPDKNTSDDAGPSSSQSNIVPQRKLSFTRGSKSHLNTGGAVLAMTGQIAAVGRGGGVAAHSSVSTGTPWSHLRRHSRSRSRSELPGQSAAPGGLFQLMTSHGGPPVPTLASPLQDKPPNDTPLTSQTPNDDDNNNDKDVDDEDDELIYDKGIIMDFPVRADLIVPTLEGFKTHVRQLNPRLQPALIERIGQEQVRRYKKLVEAKAKHSQQVNKNSCRAGKYCFAQGGEAKMLPPRTSPKDPDSTYAQFQVSGAAVTDEELASFGDGVITPALFPQGVPLPPVNRLPAEYECSLCFKVKKFMKPSDWTKHVHEDLQPFTCTFAECAEPKSFKRKADWVRHESERHRHLEWWTCNIDDCTHTCYRKDNFVQHLVREHRLPEPKIKATKARKGATNGDQGQTNPIESQAIELVCKLIEECHCVTNKEPKDEACRFCGNVCNSWKKLTVHMAKHMEQIAMPVLDLVKQRSVSAEIAPGPHDRAEITPQPQSNIWTSVGSNTDSKETLPASYDTTTFPTQSFAGTHSPLLSNGVAMSNSTESNSITQVHQQQQQPQHFDYMTSGRSYSLSPYPQAPEQKQYGANLNSAASYPPSFAALSGQPQQDIASLSEIASLSILPPPPPQQQQHELHPSQHSTAAGLAYNLDATAPVVNSGSNDQQLYASPVDNSGCMYPSDQESMTYGATTNEMNYNVIATDGSMPSSNGYIQHSGGAYQ